MATGPQNSGYQIPDLVVSDTFHDWFQVTNQEIINKLNRMSVYTLGASMDGIDGITNSAGEVKFEISDHITKGITFEGDLVFNGTVTRINSTEFSIDDYNIILGDTGPQGGTNAGTGASDSQILAGGGGGLLLARNDGDTASWLWQPGATQGGLSGAWESNSHIKLNAAARFLSGENIFRFESGSSGEHFDIRHTNMSAGDLRDWGLSGGGYGSRGPDGAAIAKVWGLEDDLILSYGSSSGGTTEFMRVHDDGYVDIPYGVNKKRIHHNNHGFTFGDAVRLDGSGGYTWGKADDTTRAEVLGLVSYVNGNIFDITYSGEIRGDFEPCLGTADGQHLVAGNAYFLSPHVEGKLTQTRPDTVNFIQKPLLLATGTGEGLVVNYLGGVVAEAMVADSSTSQRLLITATGDNYFQVADVVRMNKTNGKYVRAQCNNDEEAEALGIITKVAVGGLDPHDNGTWDYYLTTSGIVTFGVDDIALTGMTPGQVYFLNSNCSAAFGVTGNCLTTDDPDTVGFVRKPMFTAVSKTQASLLNYIGTRISDDSYIGSDGSSEGSSQVNTIFTAKRVYFETQKHLHNGALTTYPYLGALSQSDAGGATSRIPIGVGNGPELGHWTYSNTSHKYNSGDVAYKKYWGYFDLSETAMDIPNNATHVILSTFYEDNDGVGGTQLLWNAGGEESLNKITIQAAGQSGQSNTTELPIGADRKGFLTGYKRDGGAGAGPFCTVIGYITSDQIVGNYAGEEIDIETEETVFFDSRRNFDGAMNTHTPFIMTYGVIDNDTNLPVPTYSAAITNISGVGYFTEYDLFNGPLNIPDNATHIIFTTYDTQLGANSSTYLNYYDTDETISSFGGNADPDSQTYSLINKPIKDARIMTMGVGTMQGESTAQWTGSITMPIHPSGKCIIGFAKGGNTNTNDQAYANSCAVGVVGYILKKTTSIQSGAISNIDGDNNRRANFNGNFDVWQRETDGTPYTWQFDSPEYDKYIADRWHSINVYDTKTEAYRSEFEYGVGKVSGVDYLPEENSMPARYYLSFGSSGPDTPNETVGSPSIQTVIEDATLFHGKKCSFSFWLKGSVDPISATDAANSVKLRIWQYLGITGGEAYGDSVLDGLFYTGAGTGRPHTAPNPATTSPIVFNDTWQKFSGSITLPSIAGVSTPEGEGATAGVGCLGCEFLVATHDKGWVGEYSIAQFQFEVGGAVTKFESKTAAQELEGCQRYYQKSICGWDGYTTANKSYGGQSSFQTTMRYAGEFGPACVNATALRTGGAFGGAAISDTQNSSNVGWPTEYGFVVSKVALSSTDNSYLGAYEFTADF